MSISNNVTRLSWDPPADDYAKAKIEKLEKEKALLETKADALRKMVSRLSETVDAQDEEIRNLKGALLNAVTSLKWGA